MGALPSKARIAAVAFSGGVVVAAVGIASSPGVWADRAPRPPALATAAPDGSVEADADAGADAGAGADADADAGAGADAGADAGAGAAATPPFAPPAWSPASRAAAYGALSGEACERQLRARGIRATPAIRAPRVERPVRLGGPLHGVTFRGDGLAKPGATSIFEIADCRLVLALDDLAASLAARGVVEVLHLSMYRPAPAGVAPSKPGGAKGGGPRGKAKATGKARKPGAGAAGQRAGQTRPSQHALGLAIDVAAFVKADGSRLTVEADWHGAIGAPPCGPGSAPREPSPRAIELRELVCSVYASGLFNVVLTPNANAEHFNHFHFDIKRAARYFLME